MGANLCCGILSFVSQATLASLRSELDSSQSSLFEFTTRQEQAAGSALPKKKHCGAASNRRGRRATLSRPPDCLLPQTACLCCLVVLQATLASLRLELKSSQSSLSDFTTPPDLASLHAYTPNQTAPILLLFVALFTLHAGHPQHPP
jgi:hypothetical protein